MRILIIEDDAALLEQLSKQMKMAGYAVDCAADGEEGLFLGLEYEFDLVVIDLGLPKKNGLVVIEQWRAQKRTFPILILTARDSWEEKVNGLEMGADDYLTKPFHHEELLARIAALIRRANRIPHSKLDFEHFSLDLSKQQVHINQQPLELTAYEYKVLEYLVLHAEEIISKVTLTEHIYAQDFDRDSNVIEVFVKRLRHKMKNLGCEKAIKTFRGRGYAFILKKI